MESLTARPRATLGKRFERALVWACRLHRGQRKKSSDVPYVSHLLAVTALVLEDGGSESEAVAALLHDAVEDQAIGRKAIRKRFGKRVARIVDGCTEKLGPKKNAARDAKTWRKRKQRTLAYLRDPATPESVLRVTAADKLHNARTIVADLRRIGPEVWQRFNAGAVDQLWYYRSLTVIFSHRLPGLLSDELRVAVRDMESLAGWWFDVGDPQCGAPGDPKPTKVEKKDTKKGKKGKRSRKR